VGPVRMSIDAILPAGGRISGAFAEEAGAEVKALIQLGGRTLLERTIETLRVTGRVGRIIVIGPADVGDHPAVGAADAVLAEGASGPENVLKGLECLREAGGGDCPDRALVITTDLPFLTPAAVTGYLDACPADADICAPLVSRDAFEARFPGSPLVYVRLREGEFTMGCAFLLNARVMIANQGLFERAFAARKSQMAMALLLGLPFVARFLTRRLTVGQIEERCRRLLGCTAAAIRDSAPELAFDIDLPEEYRYAADHLTDERKQ